MKSLRELMDLGGRVALITGGAGHVGGASAAALAELGARVALLDRAAVATEAAAEALASEWRVETAALIVDLEDEAAVAGAPARVLERWGRLDILVNCAALTGDSSLRGWGVPFLEQSTATWRRALEVNLTAAFVLSQAAAPALGEAATGAIVNVASIYGVAGPHPSLYEGTDRGNPAAYAASKAGLIQLTRWLATSLAPRVRANAISPGGIWRGQGEPFHSRYVARTPLGRMAVEEDLKGAVAYLASDLSAYVTGQNLLVDGGWTAW